MKRILLSVCLTSLILHPISSELIAKPLSFKVVPASQLQKEITAPQTPTYELQKTPQPIAVIKQNTKPESTPQTAFKKDPSDTTAPVISNLPTSVRYIGTGEFEVSFEVNEACFMENGYSGLLAWFNEIPMTRVSGSLTSNGEKYVFRTTIPETTTKGTGKLKIRAFDAAGNMTEITNTMFVVYPELSQKDLQFVGKGPLEASFGINKALSKIKDTSVAAFLNNEDMTLISVTPYQTGEKYLFRAIVNEQTQEGRATTRLRVVDGANNVSTIQTQKVIIDTTAPQISGLSTTLDYRKEGPFVITFTVNEPVSTGLGKSKIDARFNNTPLTLISTLYNNEKETYTYRGIVDQKTKEGTGNIVIRADDAAGNSTSVTAQTIIVDLTEPQISNISVEKRFLTAETATLQFDVSEYLVAGIGQSQVRVLFNDTPMSQSTITPLKWWGQIPIRNTNW